MADVTCGICLDELKDPVSTPCGHLHCDGCLTAYVELSPDAITATCPTCRAPFSVATPDLHYVPPKYRPLIIPSVRRIYLDAPAHSSDDPAAVARLEERIQALTRDKLALMERCEAQMAAAATHASGERDARMEVDALTKHMGELRKKYDALKGKYKDLKASREAEGGPATVPATKRTSSQAALDSSPLKPGPGCSPFGLSPGEFGPRPTLRMPKRTRLLASPIDLKSAGGERGRPAQVLLFKGKRVELPHPDSFARFSASPERPRAPVDNPFSPQAGGGNGSLMYDDGMDED